MMVSIKQDVNIQVAVGILSKLVADHIVQCILLLLIGDNRTNHGAFINQTLLQNI